TGLGGAVVLDGQLVGGSGGFAGEIAHVTAVPDGQWCGCGRRGCLEQYTAGTALVRTAKRRAATGDPLMSPLLQAAGGSKREIDGPLITRLAQQGDPGAQELIAEIGTWLGRGLASIASLLDPEVFVVGGGVAEAGDLLLDPAREAYAKNLTARAHRPLASFVVAGMGSRARIVGAAGLARRAARGRGRAGQAAAPSPPSSRRPRGARASGDGPVRPRHRRHPRHGAREVRAEAGRSALPASPERRASPAAPGGRGPRRRRASARTRRSGRSTTTSPRPRAWAGRDPAPRSRRRRPRRRRAPGARPHPVNPSACRDRRQRGAPPGPGPRIPRSADPAGNRR